MRGSTSWDNPWSMGEWEQVDKCTSHLSFRQPLCDVSCKVPQKGPKGTEPQLSMWWSPGQSTLARLFFIPHFTLHNPPSRPWDHFFKINSLQDLVQALLLLGAPRLRGFWMISHFSSTNFLEVIWDLEFEQVALISSMTLSLKTKLVMSISLPILTISAERKFVEIGKGRDMEESPWGPKSPNVR